MHSDTPPSASDKMVGCTGYLKMVKRCGINRKSADSELGDAAHWAASTFLEHGQPYPNMIGREAPSGIIITEEIWEAVSVYCYDVLTTLSGLQGRGPFFIETPVVGQQIYPTYWGTPDFFCYDPVQKTIDIADYKHGHSPVYAFENWQCIGYLACIYKKLKLNGIDDQSIKVCITIVQPNCYHGEKQNIDRWEFMLSDLRAYWNILSAKIHEAHTDAARLTTGPHCKNCEARHGCKPFHQYAFDGIEYSGAVVPEVMDGEALGVELKLLEKYGEAIKARYKGLLIQAEDMIEKGKPVYGQRQTRVPGRLTWIDKNKAKETFDPNSVKKGPFYTPKQIISSDATLEDKVIELSERKSSLQLKPVNLDNTRKIFGGLKK